MSDQAVGRPVRPVDRQARARFAASRRHGGVLEEAAADDDAGEVFDPADNNIDEVLAYVDEHPETLEAIASMERAGKARTTLLAKLDEMLAAAAKADDEGTEGDGDAAGDDEG